MDLIFRTALTILLIIYSRQCFASDKTRSAVVTHEQPSSAGHSAPIVITAQSGNSGLDENKVLEVTDLPASVDFGIANDESGEVSDVLWDFGDGQSGFGRTASWKYVKPGEYKIKGILKRKDGSIISIASVKIVAHDDDCIVADGVTGCLFPSKNSNIIPWSFSTWKLQHDQGAKPFSKLKKPESWIRLSQTAALGEDEHEEITKGSIPLGEISEVEGQDINIDVKSLALKKIGLTKPYDIYASYHFAGKRIISDFYNASFRGVYLGIGSLKIESKAPGYRCIISGARSSFMKYLFAEKNMLLIEDMPVDTYKIVVQRGDHSKIYNFEIKNSNTVSLKIE